MHGITRSAITKAQRGRWSSGFWSGFASSFLAPISKSSDSFGERVISNAVIGGTVSKISGGKFSNGAVTGAFIMMFNDLLSKVEHHARNTENDRFLKNEKLCGRNNLSIDEVKSAGKYGMKQASEAETQFHRQGNGNENNLKFTSKVSYEETWFQENISNRYGRYEIVIQPNINGTYSHVMDKVNMGTLNYGNSPYTHYYKDIVPYKFYGN
jgi:hypothetical protein